MYKVNRKAMGKYRVKQNKIIRKSEGRKTVGEYKKEYGRKIKQKVQKNWRGKAKRKIAKNAKII